MDTQAEQAQTQEIEERASEDEERQERSVKADSIG